MLNLLRNVLLNLDATAQILQVSTEFQELIPNEFTPLVHSAAVEAVRKILVRSDSNKDLAAFAAKQVIVLVHSSELEVYLAPIVSVLTFKVHEDKHFNSGFEYDLTQVDQELAGSFALAGFFRTMAKTISPPVLKSLRRIYDIADTAVLRVGVVALLYFLHSAKLLGALDE